MLNVCHLTRHPAPTQRVLAWPQGNQPVKKRLTPGKNRKARHALSGVIEGKNE
jgi:hypothetical protein